MSSIVVVGNGESRKNLDLSPIIGKIPVIGCNAIYRDYNVDHLICCDKRMVVEALTNKFQNNIYTRFKYYKNYKKILKHKNVKKLPDIPYTGELKRDDPLHWGSGAYALLLAANLGYKKIHIIGFDFYGIDNKVNNIYKGTLNYSAPNVSPVDPSFWIYQSKKILDHYPDQEFYFYNSKNWKVPIAWNNENLFVKTVEIFLENCLTLNTMSV